MKRLLAIFDFDEEKSKEDLNDWETMKRVLKPINGHPLYIKQIPIDNSTVSFLITILKCTQLED